MLNINPDLGALRQTINTTAGARLAREVSAAASPRLLRDVQNVMKVGGVAGRALGVSTGVGAIDGLLGLTGGRDGRTPLLGGLSLRQAQAIHDQSHGIRAARRNLWFIRINDRNPPREFFQAAPSNSLKQSRIGPVVLPGGAWTAGAPTGGATRVADVALSSFDLLAVDVSYGSSLTGEADIIGTTFVDRPTGRSQVEVMVTTMDDEAGSIKRWFAAKQRQVAAPDGTVGLPADYLVDMEIVHAIPSDKVENYSLAYSSKMGVRVQSIQHELSRRDQGLAEIQLQFVEFDPFMKTGT